MSDPVVTVEIVEDVTEVTVSPRVTTVDAVEQPLTIDLQENTTTVELRGISIASSNAGAISIDSSNNYLTSTSVQGAIDELTNSLTAGPGISFSAGVISNAVELNYKAEGENNLETLNLGSGSLIFSGTSTEVDVSAPANDGKVTFGLASILQNSVTAEGSETSVPQISVDLKGRVTSVTPVPIQISKSSVTSLISTLESHSAGELANTQAIQSSSALILSNILDIDSHSSTLVNHADLINTNIADIQSNSGAVLANNSKVDSISSTVASFTSSLETNSGKILANTSDIQSNSAAITAKYDKTGGAISGNVSTSGSLTVAGSTNLNSATVNVQAEKITLNATRNAEGVLTSATNTNSGLYVYTGTVEGTAQYKKIEYNINTDTWTINGKIQPDMLLDTAGDFSDGILSVSSGVLSWKTFDVQTSLESLSGRVLTNVEGLHSASSSRVVLSVEADDLQDSISSNLLAIHSISSRVVTNVAEIESNSSKIASNLTKVETNSGLILALSPATLQTLSAEIVANTESIQSSSSTIVSNLESNNLGIQTNSSKTASNLAKIETNSSLIATNITSIQTNSSLIATNITGIQTNSGLILTNIAEIESNSSKIASNLSKIQTNSSLIATNIPAIQTNSSKIASNLSKIQTNSSLIATNITGIQTNSGLLLGNTASIQSSSSKIAANTTATETNSGLILSNIASIQSSSTKIVSNLTSIQTNSSRLVEQRNTLKTTVRSFYAPLKGKAFSIVTHDSGTNMYTVQYADSDGAGQMPAFGIAMQTVASPNDPDFATGYIFDVLHYGLLEDFDTSHLSLGHAYVGNGGGILTSTPPVALDTDLQAVGNVIHSSSVSGKMVVDIQAIEPPSNLLLEHGHIAYGGVNGQQTATLDGVLNNISGRSFAGTLNTLQIRASELGTGQRQNPTGPILIDFAEIDGTTDNAQHTNRTVFHTHIQNSTADTGAVTLVNPAPGGSGYGYNLGYSMTWGFENTNYGYTNAMFGGNGTIPRSNNANIVGGWGNTVEGTGSDRNLLVGGTNKLDSGCIDSIIAGNSNYMSVTAYSILAGSNCKQKGTGSLTFGNNVIMDVANQSLAVGAATGYTHNAIASEPNKYHWTAANWSINIGYANSMGVGADYSACFGAQNRVGADDELQQNLSSEPSTTPYATGETPNKPARYSLVAGRGNQLKESSYSLVAGHGNTANSDYTYILGGGCTTAGFAGMPYQALIGKQLISPKHTGDVNIGEAQTVVGRYNDFGSFDSNLRNMPEGGWYQDNTHLFTVGSGTSVNDRKNSFIIIPRQTHAATTRDFCGIAMPILADSTSCTNDADAADKGVPIGGLYRTGSTIKIRVS